MNIKVMYYSKGGNTKKVAQTISQAINQPAESIPPAYPAENIRLLFLGGGVYGGKLDPKLTEYINTLTPEKIKNVALFSTSGSGQGDGIRLMKEALEKKGLHVLDENFVCCGKYFIFFKRNHPDADELKAAQDFAKKAVEKLEKE
ncbi:MAG TPA: flavodoxin family protein [Clostridia bacterium]|nr:flavodoxin family protein [Clostridia bacterium]